jgi:hypothetical protein
VDGELEHCNGELRVLLALCVRASAAVNGSYPMDGRFPISDRLRITEEEFQKLSEKEQNAQWDRELDSMTEEDLNRFYFNLTGRHLGDPIPPEKLVDADEFFENPNAFE